MYCAWLNIHGGFGVGLVLFSVYIIEKGLRHRPVQHLILVLAGVLAVVAINPYGPEYYRYLSTQSSRPATCRALFRPLDWERCWISSGRRTRDCCGVSRYR